MKYFIVVLIGYLVSALLGQEVHQVDRTSQLKNPDPPVLRCVLDENPRMVVIDFGEGYWGAWSAVSGSLYKVWKGDVNFDGAVFTTRHGPQPVSRGVKVVPGNPIKDNPWVLRRQGIIEEFDFKWRGYSISNNRITLNYILIDKNKNNIEVRETPYIYKNKSNEFVFSREIKVLGNSSDTVIEWSLSNRHGDGSRVEYFDGITQKKLSRSLGRSRTLRIPQGESRVIEAKCLKIKKGSPL